MGNTGTKGRWLRDAGIRALMALVLALGMMPLPRAAAWAEPPGNDVSTAYVEGDRAAGEEVREALAENADADLAGEVLPEEAGAVESVMRALGLAGEEDAGNLTDTGQVLLVKYTIADASMVAEGDTIDSLFASEEGRYAIAGQYSASAPLYEIDPQADCYAAYIDAPGLNGTATIKDHAFAMNNAHAEAVEGAVYDTEAGIAYIPKGYLEGADGTAPVQLQVLACADLAASADEPAQVAVKVDGGGTVDVPADVSVREGALDMTTTIPVATPDTAADIDLADLSVTLNGADEPVKLEEGVASYDPETGMLTLAVNPMSVASVDVQVERGFALAERAYAKVTTTGDWFLKNSSGNKITLKHLDLDSLSVGNLFKASKQRIGYIGKGVKKDADIVAATESYLYSWSLYPEKLYAKIKDTTDEWKTYNVEGTDSAPNNLQVATGLNWVTHTIPVPSGKVGGQNWKGFGSLDGLALACGHVSDPIDSLANTNEDVYGQVWWRVLAMSTTADDPYIILGFVCGAIVGQAGVGIYKVAIEPNGKLELEKSSSNPSMTDGNPLYSLEGAEYGVYSSSSDAASDNDREDTLTVGADGKSNKVTLPAGDYYVKELTAPEGYILDENTHKVTVTAGETETFEVADKPVGDPDEAFKRDQTLGRAAAQGAATIQGAEFTFRYYTGYYTAANLPSTPTRSWVLKAGTDGKVNLRYGDTQKVSGDDFYRDDNGIIIAPIGTITVTETKAPDGYLLGYYDSNGTFHAPQTYITQLKQHEAGSAVVDHDAVNYTLSGDAAPVDDSVKRGNVKGVKHDSKTAAGLPQGAATLAGAKIEVVNRTGGIVVSPESRREVANNEVVCTLTTGEDGAFSTTRADLNGWSIPKDWAGKALPVGAYLLREVAPSEGYLLNSTWSASVTVTADGDELDAGTLPEDVIRGDIEFTKKHGMTMKPLVGVPFVIESKTTGERHLAVTDSNGEVSTSAGFNAHTQKTNANDAALSGGDGTEYTADASALDATAGIWFDGRNGDGGAPVDDALGALPYDTYTLTEVRCAANEGLELVTFEMTVSRHGRTVDEGTVDDEPSPSIGTTLTDGAGTHTVAAEKEAVLTDSVAYNDFPLGEHRFAGELHLVGSDGTDKGVVAEAEKTANITTPNGTVELTFTVDTSGLPGTGDKLVAFERAYNADAEQVAEHADLDDEGQTVTVAEIGTTLTDAADGDHTAASTGEVTLTDTVAYKGLTPGKRYAMNLTLHKKAADGTDGGVLTGTDGKEVAKTATFTPTTSDGSVTVTVTFTPAAGEGYDVVAFEELTHGGDTYAIHADISDESQTVHLPGIATTALDKETGTHVGKPTGKDAAIDTVAYGGLVPGGSYVMKGTLANAADATPVATAEKQFNASSTGSGTVELEFAFDATAVNGGTVVVLEQLYPAGGTEPIATHEELTDEDQTVRYPSIGTTATDSKSGKHKGEAAATVEIVDTVAYTGLIAGQKYEVRGTVMDKSSGKQYVDASKKPVEATKTFKAKASSGTVEVPFKFDGTALKGATLVVFEEVYAEGGEEPVAVHEDLEDKDQTVTYTVPKPKVTSEESGNPGSDEPAKFYDRTGDWLRSNWPWLLAGAALVAAGAFLWLRGRRAGDDAEEDAEQD